MSRPPSRLPSILILVAHGLLLSGAAAGFLWIRALGERLLAPPPQAMSGGGAAAQGQAAGVAQQHILLHVLLALVVIIVVARAMGMLFRGLRQPPVIGEVVAGLLLGPSVLGRLWPAVSGYLLPPSIAPLLSVLSQVGVILYMFLVGLEFDPGIFREHGRSVVAISQASMVVPFFLGCVLALGIYPILSTSDVCFGVYALFIGVSLSVTAFPVLARILTDRGIQRSGLGRMALSCAAAGDAAAWCLLALVAGVASAHFASALLTVGLTIGYVAFMVAVGRPVARRFIGRLGAGSVPGTDHPLSQTAIAIVFALLLVSSLITEYIGIHAMFGAFLLGAIIPHDSPLAAGMRQRLEDMVAVFLLPAFFAFTGLRTQVGLVSGGGQWLLCGLIVLVASLGKFGGSAVAARLTGLGWRESAALGVLMNTRGLMELIVLNLGLDLHIISPSLFAMMVLMALATTMATAPLLDLLVRPDP